MRKASIQRSQARKFTTAWKLGILALILSTGFSAPVMAEEKSCNPDLDFTILNEGPFFLGETLRISANLGARDIVGGTAQDISAFGFALNCHLGEDYQNCESAGNTVQVLGNPTTNCKNSQGEDATLLFPQGNKIPIEAIGFPIRTGPGEQCNVQFDMKVTGLAEGNKKVVQAMGWPFENKKATLCDNGLTSTASATIAFDVETCDINVEKQVWDPTAEDWVDADTAETAVDVLNSAEYRLVVTNTGTAGYVEKISVNDLSLGIATSYAFPDGPGPLILTKSEISGLLKADRCEGQAGNTISNLASVGAVCRAGDNPVTASDDDMAWVDCAPDVRESSVAINKTTNGEDADEPTGPLVAVGSTVTWQYQVVNTGETTLTEVVVTDSDIGPITCPKSVLAPEEQMFCEANGTAIEGQYGNIGTVVAQGENGPVTDDDPSHYYGFAADIQIIKTGLLDLGDNGNSDPGDLITYSFQVTNTSDVVLTDVTVTDPLEGLSEISCPEPGNGNLVLNPADIVTCSATYGITEDDIAAGERQNLASVTGNPPSGPPVTDDDPETVPIPVISLVVEKSVENVMVNDNGSLDVTYRVTVTNDGGYDGVYDLEDTLMVDEALTAVDVVSGVTYVPGTDAGTDGNLNDDLAVEDFAPTAELVSDESLAAGMNEAFEFVVQFEIDGLLTTVEGANCNPDDDGDTNTGLTNYVQVLVGGEVVDDAVACDEFELTPDILIVKEIWDGDGWVETAGPVEAPSGALYRLTVTNTGNIALLSVVVTDPMLGDPETVYYEFGPLLVGEAYVIEAGQGADGSWPLLDVAEVCGEDDRGDHTNTATAAGMWEVDGDTVTDTDMATLQCIGPPEIAILKEISIDGGPWLDANVEPWATAVYDIDNPVPAEYRLTVSNISTEGVDLFDVVVNDGTLGIENYPVGTLLAGGDPVVIGSGQIQLLAVSSICDGFGEVNNLASATGTSAAGESNTADDPATIECVGKPDISILKEVSSNGIDWSETSVSANAPADGYWRITVTNTGDAPLTNVTVDDDKLGIVNMAIPDLEPGDSVTLVHANPGDGQIVNTNLFKDGFCGSNFVDINTAWGYGDSIYGGDSVNASDSATYSCFARELICDKDTGTRPSAIKVTYNGTPGSDNDQVGDVNSDPNADMSTVVSIGINDGKKDAVTYWFPAIIGAPITIDGKFNSTGNSNKIPPNIVVDFVDADGNVVQHVEFHGSCSAPLNIGDQYGGITIIGYTP